MLTEEKEKIRVELTAKVQAAEDAKAAALAQVKKAQKELADAMQEAQDLHVQVQQAELIERHLVTLRKETVKRERWCAVVGSPGSPT